jgi:hypothetical protein
MPTTINYWNRRELITVSSVRELLDAKERLYNAGIACRIKPMGRALFRFDYRSEMPTCDVDKSYHYVIFVMRSDYEHALCVMNLRFGRD